jgi:hypothetical protein
MINLDSSPSIPVNDNSVSISDPDIEIPIHQAPKENSKESSVKQKGYGAFRNE